MRCCLQDLVGSPLVLFTGGINEILCMLNTYLSFLLQDGFIDFLEFIAAINLIIRGKIDQKLKWYFKLYDADGNGAVEKREIVKIFRVRKLYIALHMFNTGNQLFEHISASSVVY